MGKFIVYTVIGTLATFAILLHLSLMPHLMQMPGFAHGVTVSAIVGEIHAFALTLALSWIAWWSVSGLFFLILHSLGKYTGIVLFFLSLGTIFGITVLIN